MQTTLIHHREREVALIVPTSLGNWTVLLPGAGRNVGTYATPCDAARFATLNGYQSEIQESAQ